jgi:hypothetical protein
MTADREALGDPGIVGRRRSPLDRHVASLLAMTAEDGGLRRSPLDRRVALRTVAAVDDRGFSPRDVLRSDAKHRVS